MPRRRVIAKREVLPDPKFNNQVVAKFINHVMVSGKKAVAENIVYGALDRVQARDNADPIEVFEKALEAIAPMVEVKSRRVGGATYQVPVEVRPSRRQGVSHALVGRQRSFAERKVNGGSARRRILDAAEGRGSAVKKREDTHRMADANKAFAHYRY